MKPGVPWSVKGVEPQVRVAARNAARRAGMTMGEWLNSVILDQNEHIIDSLPSKTIYPGENYVSSAPHNPEPPPRDEQPRPAASARRDDSTRTLQDIAQQLADLAQKERQSAAIQPYEPPRRRTEDDQALARMLERIDDNERQTVGAFSAINDRLTVLGQQIAMLPRARALDRPEDVPGYSVLETAIRNVVEHIEVSEKRTRDTLKSVQDRLGELAEQAARQPRPEDVQRTAPVLASLEARLVELSNRMQRTESAIQTGLPDTLRRELGQLSERIESVRSSSDQIVKQAQTSAAGVARSEIREIETRVLAMIQETQAAAGSAVAAGPEIGQLRGEIGGLARRVDEVRSFAATERDLSALRIAVEQLSTRVAQGQDMRPLAEMDRRLANLGRRIDQVAEATGGLGQRDDLEARIAELGQRLEAAMGHQGDPRAFESLERSIATVSERVGRTEDQLRHIETMEDAIRQLYGSLEQSRDAASQAAEAAASRTVQNLLGGASPGGASPELRALEDGLRAVRESAVGAERSNQDTFAAVHETLSQIVAKIAELESGPAAGRDQARAESLRPTEVHRDERPEPYMQPGGGAHSAGPSEPLSPPPGAPPLSTGDDFIAAARRAAQAASSRPSALRAEIGVIPTPPEEESGFSLFRKFRKQAKADAAPNPAVAKPGVAKSAVAKPADDAASRRRRLLLAGIVLLAAVSAFAFNALVKKPAPEAPPAAIEAPIPQAPAPEAPAPQPPATGGTAPQTPVPAAPDATGSSGPSQKQGRADLAVDRIITGSLPVDSAGNRLEAPAAEAGTQALRDAAARGDARAQFIVATNYLDGSGIAADPAQAAYWYEQAALSGLAPAQYRLGTLYERGKGVALNAAAALSWYEKAARQGNVKSMHNAAVILMGGQAGAADSGKALALFTDAAERGLADSQFNLAILRERGVGGSPDKAEAYVWYRLAEQQGDAHAAQRAATLAKSLTPQQLAQADTRIAAFKPRPSVDSANVVAITEDAWQNPDSSVLVSAAAVPAAPQPAQGDLVIEAQHLLTQLGFNVGEPDGKLGTRTANAIRLFQLQSGLEVTGELTPEVLNVMRAKAG